jgi:hypothetical protein
MAESEEQGSLSLDSEIVTVVEALAVDERCFVVK